MVSSDQFRVLIAYPNLSMMLTPSYAVALFTVDGFLGLDFLSMLDRPDLPTVIFRKDFIAFLETGNTPVEVQVRPDDLSDVLFTSGTSC